MSSSGAKYTKVFSRVIMVIIFVMSVQVSTGQSKENATAAFENGDYISAEREFAKLYEQFPADPIIGLSYAASLVNSQKELPKAIRILKALDVSETSSELFFYLGKAYMLEYNIPVALDQFTQFENYGSDAQKRKFRLEQYLNYCQNWNSSVSSYPNYTLKSSAKIDIERAYSLVPGLGNEFKCATISETNKSKQDKKRLNHFNFLQSKHGNETYFASFGKRGNNGLDIYFSYWENRRSKPAKPESLDNIINSSLNELNPVVISAHEIYFCSNGPGSIGGYDVFRATFNSSEQQWNEPENLGFPINTPFDDFLYIPAGNSNELVLFSNRSCRIDSTIIFKIQPVADSLISINDARDLKTIALFQKPKELSKPHIVDAKEELFSSVHKDEIKGKQGVLELIAADILELTEAIEQLDHLDELCGSIYDYKVKGSIIKRKEANNLLDSFSALTSEKARNEVNKTRMHLLKVSDTLKNAADFTEQYLKSIDDRRKKLLEHRDFYTTVESEVADGIMRPLDAVDYVNQRRSEFNNSEHLFNNLSEDLKLLQAHVAQKTLLVEESNGLLSEIKLRLGEYQIAKNETERNADKIKLQNQIDELDVEYVLAQRKMAKQSKELKVLKNQQDYMVLLAEEIELLDGTKDDLTIRLESTQSNKGAESVIATHDAALEHVVAPELYHYQVKYATINKRDLYARIPFSKKDRKEFDKAFKIIDKAGRAKSKIVKTELKLDKLERTAKTCDKAKKLARINKQIKSTQSKLIDVGIKYYSKETNAKYTISQLLDIYLKSPNTIANEIIAAEFKKQQQLARNRFQSVDQYQKQTANRSNELEQLQAYGSFLDSIRIDQNKAYECLYNLVRIDSISDADYKAQERKVKRIVNFVSMEEYDDCFITVQLGVISVLDADSVPLLYTDFLYTPFDDQFKVSTGRFKNIEKAREFQKEVRKNGVVDAFIVAYNNSEKIDLYEASRILAGIMGNTKQFSQVKDLSGSEELFYSVQIGVFAKAPNALWLAKESTDLYRIPVSGSKLYKYSLGKFNAYKEARDYAQYIQENFVKDAFVSKLGLSVHEEKTVKHDTSSSKSVLSGELSSITKEVGRFYTVQIAVLNRRYDLEHFRGLSQVYIEPVGNNFKYYAGQFQSEKVAQTHQTMVRALGFSDAFVVQYVNGSRVIPRMKPAIKSEVNEKQSKAVKRVSSKAEPIVQEDAIIFKIQIASYIEQAPDDIIAKFIEIAGTYTLSDFLDVDKRVYTIGDFENYQDAISARIELIERGAPDSFVIAFKGYEKITVSEAIRLINNR